MGLKTKNQTQILLNRLLTTQHMFGVFFFLQYIVWMLKKWWKTGFRGKCSIHFTDILFYEIYCKYPVLLHTQTQFILDPF